MMICDRYHLLSGEITNLHSLLQEEPEDFALSPTVQQQTSFQFYVSLFLQTLGDIHGLSKACVCKCVHAVTKAVLCHVPTHF